MGTALGGESDNRAMVVSVVAKYMQAYKQFGWRAALTKMYTVSFCRQEKTSNNRLCVCFISY